MAKRKKAKKVTKPTDVQCIQVEHAEHSAIPITLSAPNAPNGRFPSQVYWIYRDVDIANDIDVPVALFQNAPAVLPVDPITGMTAALTVATGKATGDKGDWHRHSGSGIGIHGGPGGGGIIIQN